MPRRVSACARASAFWDPGCAVFSAQWKCEILSVQRRRLLDAERLRADTLAEGERDEAIRVRA